MNKEDSTRFERRSRNKDGKTQEKESNRNPEN
jgi:hypothetical protein